MEQNHESELLKRARSLDEKALVEVYDRWSPALYRYAMRLLSQPEQAEECVAETFSRFLTVLKQGKGPRDHLQAYLYRVAHNWITDRYRNPEPTLLPLDPDLHAATEEEPPHAAAREMERQKVRKALIRLTPDQQQVIVLKYLEDLDNESIARVLNKPVGAVKALQHRALQNLRRLLPPGEEETK